MNKCFKVIFNHARNCFMVVSESSSSVQRPNGKIVALLSFVILMGFNSNIVYAESYELKTGEGPGIALGSGASATGSSHSIAIGNSPGYQANASGDGAIAIGFNVQATAEYATAVGRSSQATGSNSSAFGIYAKAEGERSVALGRAAHATSESSIALGASSLADRGAGEFGSGASSAVYFTSGSKDGLSWVSTSGNVSIGSDTITRQLTGVAAGSQETDAVNVAQLRDLKSYTDEQLTSFQQAAKENTIIGSGASIHIPEDTTDPDNVVAARDAVNASVFGENAKVQMDNSVAIGANSVASNTGRNAAVQFKPADAAGGAWQSEGLVSFGYTETTGEGTDVVTTTHNRTLTGVAAGSEDNDAVNVAQLKEVNNQVEKLTTGQTAISKVDLLANPDDPTSGGIGLRFEAATQPGVSAEGMAAQAEGDEIGRLAYTDIDGTKRQVATMSDGFTISAGSSSSAARDGTESVKVDLNKGISFLTDSEYLSTNVAADGKGGAVVTFNTTQALKDALANAGGNTGGNTGGDSGNTGDTGGSGWNPSQAQLAAMNGNFVNGITVAPGEGNQAIQIKQGNVDMGGNRIQNVGNPINDGDAANKAYVDSTSRSLRNKINDVDKDLRAGVAMAMAVGGLPQAYMPGKSIFGVSAGTYHGQGGFALGLSHATDNRQWVFKGAASVDTRGNFGGTLSAGYQF